MEKKFNQNQQLCINNLVSNILLLAPAGTGKTSVLSHRINKIIAEKKALPNEILCLTFTNKASNDMISKINNPLVLIKTFHGFCFQLLKEFSEIPLTTIIFDEYDSLEVLKEMKLPLFLDLKELLNFIKFLKKSSDIFLTKNFKEYFKDYLESKLDFFFPKTNSSFSYELDLWLIDNFIYTYNLYTTTLTSHNAIDFDDILILIETFLNSLEINHPIFNRYKYIHIDESQDTTFLEYKIISKFFNKNIIFLSGDINQSIYQWRGADPENIYNNFKTNYKPKEIILSENFRSTKTIINASSDFLTNSLKVQSNISSHTPILGDRITVASFKNSFSEFTWIHKQILDLRKDNPNCKICILSRTNYLIKNLEDIFINLSKKNANLHFITSKDIYIFKNIFIKKILSFYKIIYSKNDSYSLKYFLKNFYSLDFFKFEKSNYGSTITDFLYSSTYNFHDPYHNLLEYFKLNKVIIIDVETTGLDFLHDDIIQISAIKITNNFEEIDIFNRFIKTEKTLTNSHIHNISKEFLEINGENLETVLKDLKNFINDNILIGHNIIFDLTMLNESLKKVNMAPLKKIKYFDTLYITKSFFPNLKKFSLEYLFKHFNLKNKPTHNSLDDVRATLNLLEILIKKLIETKTERISHYKNSNNYFANFFKFYNTTRNSFINLSDILNTLIRKKIIKPKLEEEYMLENLKKIFIILDSLYSDKRILLEKFLNLSSFSPNELLLILYNSNEIPILTIHQSKGLEYDYIFLPSLTNTNFPNPKGNLDEEKRLFYVGLTRASKKIYLTYSNLPSPFIKNIPKKFLITEKYL
ncbi:MAG: 3'-5' exonuclease [Cetobacterium sp.]|uniref:3'-5' exonuclease n=1 Tax=Cetobacterium sp. TaxID=2071632 RepID=UPI003F306D06